MICVIRFHGKGKLIFPNGGTFTADWINGEAVTPETGNGVSADLNAITFSISTSLSKGSLYIQGWPET